MSTAHSQEKATLEKDTGMLIKIFTAIHKLIAKEFLWIILILGLGLPMGLFFTYVIPFFASEEVLLVLQEILKDIPLFIPCYILSLMGIYFTRTVIAAIKLLINKPKV